MSEVIPRFHVTSVGETMLRLCAPPQERLISTAELKIRVGGAESNVLATLAQLNRRCAWLSQLPDHALGQYVLQQLNAVRVNTDGVRMVLQGRLGLNFFESGVPPFPANVIYDRADSAFANITPEDVNWDHLLDTHVIHLTGITPALSPGCLEITKQAIKEAKRRGVKISFDINFRSKLWSPEAALHALSELISDVDLLFCSRRDAEGVFGCDGDDNEVIAGLRRCTNADVIVLSLAEKGAIVANGPIVTAVSAVPVDIVDRPGAGDALAAGVLDGYLDGVVEEGVKRGVVLASLALTQLSDFALINRNELISIITGQGLNIIR